VSALLREPSTTFMVVTTLETTPSVEAQRFVDALRSRRLHLGLLVANKVLPESLADARAAHLAERLEGDSKELAESVAGELAGDGDVSPVALARVLQEVGTSFLRFRHVARREAELLAQLGRAHELTVPVPHLARDITDLESLLELANQLFGDAAPAA
jgi:anion-transporting  ArsA/GET3 family ATPase